MDYTQTVNPSLLKEELLVALGYAVPFTVRDYYYITFPDISAEEQVTVEAVLTAHNPAGISTAQQAEEDKRAAIADILDRLDLSVIAGKTPQQIYTLMQGQIDGWASLADAQSDLREWLPLIAAAVVWLVKR